MERLDAIVAGIGVLVVAVALGGVIAAGPGGAGAAFHVVFTEQRVAVEAQEGAFAGDGSAEVPVEVAVANLTRLEFTVRLSGAGPRAAADAVEVTLEGPDGRSETQRGQLPPGGAAEVALTFTRTVRALPPAQDVEAASEAAAVAAAEVPPAPANGTGTWTFTVSASSGAIGPLHAEAHDIVVDTVAFAYRGVVQPEVANPR